MQADTFADERMKILYALSFMCGGTGQVWAVNETMAVINGTTQMQTFDIFLENVKKTFGNPDRAWMAHAQLHELKMTPGLWQKTIQLNLKCSRAEQALTMQCSKTYMFGVSPFN